MARTVVAAAMLASTGACDEIDPPPRPAMTRVATTVGRLADITAGNSGYVLTDGTVVVIGQAGSPDRARRMSESDVWLPSVDAPGGLLLYGEDDAGSFYAATLPPDGTGCFGLRALGYIETDRLHLSTGLVLPFAEDVERRNDRGYYDPAWLLAADYVCLDEDGVVTSIHQLPLGA